MTETDWLLATDPAHLLDMISEPPTDRKTRLWLCACSERALVGSSVEELHAAIPVVELFTDNAATSEELLEARRTIELWMIEMCKSLNLRADALGMALQEEMVGLEQAGMQAKRILEGWQMNVPELDLLNESRAQCDLLREIFGNPVLPVAVDPDWLTQTVVSVARQMYESRDFSTMPILADALQDAGCENVAVLAHCRQPGVHVRGCWVIDMILQR